MEILSHRRRRSPSALAEHIKSIGGTSALSRALGVTPVAVRAVIRRDIYPARWYAAITDLCRQQGLPDPPRDCFNFVRGDQDAAQPDHPPAPETTP